MYSFLKGHSWSINEAQWIIWSISVSFLDVSSFDDQIFTCPIGQVNLNTLKFYLPAMEFFCKNVPVVMFMIFRNVTVFKDFPPICPYFLGFMVSKSENSLITFVFFNSSLPDSASEQAGGVGRVKHGVGSSDPRVESETQHCGYGRGELTLSTVMYSK